MSSNNYFKKPPPKVGEAAHKVNVRQPPQGTVQPVIGSHPKGGENASTVSQDSGGSYTNQQQQSK
jgi:hypothetical protein